MVQLEEQADKLNSVHTAELNAMRARAEEAERSYARAEFDRKVEKKRREAAEHQRQMSQEQLQHGGVETAPQQAEHNKSVQRADVDCKGSDARQKWQYGQTTQGERGSEGTTLWIYGLRPVDDPPDKNIELRCDRWPGRWRVRQLGPSPGTALLETSNGKPHGLGALANSETGGSISMT